MRRFDLKDELRATAERRKRPEAGGAPAGMRGEGVAQIAARLAVMFPSLPGDTVEAVLSQLFRADAAVSREQLADRAVNALLEMSLADGAPQCVTSFEPRSTSAAAAAAPAGGAAVEAPDLAAPRPEGQPHGPLAAQALRSAGPGDPATASPSSAADLAEDGDALDELLDERLAELLGFSDEDLAPCARTMLGVLDRIAEEPENARVRRLRLANAKFGAAVGRHGAALELLRLAGFVDDAGEGGEDKAVAFFEDPKASLPFARVREALSGVVEELSARTPAAAAAATAGRPAAGVGAGGELRGERRRHIAELTEQRLRDPRAFRDRAAAVGAANRSVGGRLRKPAAVAAKPDRRAQHFTLADVERMRIADEIASTPSYAEEYRRSEQSAPVHDYSSMVARGYDFGLISRQALDGTNAYRASKGLPPCRWDDRIARVAAEHAAQMASGAAPFNHDGFDARVAAFPFAYRGAAENLALNQGLSSVAQVAVDGWIKSPGHEKNLRGNYNLCGIGTARSSNGTFYLTQLFALAA